MRPNILQSSTEIELTHSQLLMQAPPTTGDAAVDGLLNGAVAGVVMAIYLAAINLATGTSLTATLSVFDLGQGSSPVRGALIHLALATIYGIVFSLVFRMIGRGIPAGRGHALASGLVYGVLLWLMMQIAFAGGLNVPLSNLAVVHFALAHVVYGLTLGWLSGRSLS
jgi:hypothetical protein